MRLLFRISLPLFLLIPSYFPAFAAWQQPTPEELKMTSDPAVPGAEAVILYREETTNDNLHTLTIYERVKVLTEKGKEDYSDVEVGVHEGREFHVKAVEGRTIEPDGTIVPFTGKIFDRMLVKNQDTKIVSTVFSMPAVQVGSILEYRFDVQYDDGFVRAPRWYLEGPLYVHRAHYQFIPYANVGDVETEGGVAAISYVQLLPKGESVQQDRSEKYTLDVKDIPAELSEDYLPPLQSLSYRVLFYYTGYHANEAFWKGEGKGWSKSMDEFAAPSKKLAAQASEITAGASTPDEKLKRLYAAVMKMDNTDFSREHTAQENKAEGVKKVNNAEELFDLQRGSSDQLALLFIALARSAGFKAYAMEVVDRDRDLFQETYLSLSQLDDVVAIVEVDGKEVYLDPGERYCTFGTLSWKHTMTSGLRQTDHGTEIATTPMPNLKENGTQRVADLTVDPSGKVEGIARIFMTGEEALRWRQWALRTDEAAVRKEFDSELQKDVPDGVQVKTKSFANLDNPDLALMALVDVSGSMGTATSKRIFLPSYFFQTNKKPIFAPSTRKGPVDLHYPYVARDIITLNLPPASKVESSPQNQTLPFQNFAFYKADVSVSGNQIVLDRTMAVVNTLYKVDEYPALKGFFDKVNASDREQIVLDRSSGSNGQ